MVHIKMIEVIFVCYVWIWIELVDSKCFRKD